MCGITGIVEQHARPLGPIIRAMTESLAHRGPDDQGFALFEPGLWATVDCAPETRRDVVLPEHEVRLALGHRRLSIIDTSPAGHEPMTDATRRFWLSYNGELYNYLELRAELQARGSTFHSSTDTEVLIEAWRHWGPSCFDRMIGMWSFALYDAETRQLVLSRDPFGIKPLYLARGTGRLAFASEPAALLHLPWLEGRVDPQRAFDYLRYGRSDDGTSTFFLGIERFPAGHYAVIDLDRPADCRPIRYWHDRPEVDEDIGMTEAAATLRELLLSTVELHLRSDVPVGAALSGGLDSSTLVCLMRQVFGDSIELHTFSYLADDPALNEQRWVDSVAKRVAPLQHAVAPTEDELLEDVDTLVRAHGEPMLGLSFYAEFRVYRLAREAGITVMLDGQGADEMFGGYSPYLGPRLATMLRRGRLPSAARFWRTASASPHARALSRSVGVHAARSALPAWVEPLGRRLMKDGPLPSWLKSTWFEEQRVSKLAHRSPTDRWMLQAALADDREHMFQGQLRSEDRDAMWHSIENRVPFLTAPLVQFARSLPEELLIDEQAVPKAVLRKAMRGIVPDDVLDRQEKVGFAPPEHRWLQALEPWTLDSLQILRKRGDALVDVDALRTAWTTSGGSRAMDGALWRAANLGRWMDCHDLEIDSSMVAEAATS